MSKTAVHATPVVRAPVPAPAPSLMRPVLQRKCACGGSGDECEECRRDGPKLRRSAAGGHLPASLPPIVDRVLRSPGEPIDADVRRPLEARFGHDFSHVHVHTDATAAASARSVNALAYTVGPEIVFGTGQYAPRTRTGRRLLAHELTHVVQQRGRRNPFPQPQRQVARLPGGGYRIAIASLMTPEADPLEREANVMADRVVDRDTSHGERIDRGLVATSSQPQIQRVRVPLPNPKPLCGRTLTHIDIEPPRWRPLQPCLPPSILVNRINIVGRDLSVPGRGPQVFNLHVGYYRDPAGRLCVIADDSKTCIAPRCLFLGCFPTLREVFDAILEFLKKALIVLGIIALAIIIALIIEALAPILVPAAAAAAAAGAFAPGAGDESESAAGAVA